MGSDPIEESCKGSLDYNGFSKLDKICKDCFNLIREPEIYQLCRLVNDISCCFSYVYYFSINFVSINLDFVLLNFRTDCFCNEFFSFCARDIEGLEENEIPKLPNSCLISNEKEEEDTTTVTSKPDETTKVTSDKPNTKTLDDKSFSNSSSKDKKLNKHD